MWNNTELFSCARSPIPEIILICQYPLTYNYKKWDKINMHYTIRHTVVISLNLAPIYNSQSIRKPLAVNAYLLKTSKWPPKIWFRNIMVSLFWLPCLLILPYSLLTRIMNVRRSLVPLARRSLVPLAIWSTSELMRE